MSATILYDGKCPFCSRYVRYLRLEQAAGDIRLVDARTGGPEVEEARRRRLTLDEGMILILGEAYYHGDEAMHRIVLMSSRTDWFNRLNYLLFKSPRLSKVVYPVLKTIRNVTLRLLGRPKMGF